MVGVTLSQSAGIHFERLILDRPSEEVRHFVQQCADDADRKSNMRTAPRYPAAMEVLCVPFDADERQCGNPVVLLSRNISVGGVSLIHIRPLPAKYLLVHLNYGKSEEIRSVVEVLRCRRIGRFFEIAGNFTAKFGTHDQASESAPG